jgi:hypothetical protein
MPCPVAAGSINPTLLRNRRIRSRFQYKHLKKLVAVYVQLMYTYPVRDEPEFNWDEHNERHLALHGISRSDAEDGVVGESTSFWNTVWKGRNNAGLLSVRLAPAAY